MEDLVHPGQKPHPATIPGAEFDENLGQWKPPLPRGWKPPLPKGLNQQQEHTYSPTSCGV